MTDKELQLNFSIICRYLNICKKPVAKKEFTSCDNLKIVYTDFAKYIYYRVHSLTFERKGILLSVLKGNNYYNFLKHNFRIKSKMCKWSIKSFMHTHVY